MKRLLVLVCLSTCATAAQAADSALAKISHAGKLVVAVDATYPPMESEDVAGKLVGFDIDFAKEVGKRLGVTTEFMIMGWEGIIGGLVSKRYDLIISSMNITPDRQKQIDFVEYARMSQMFVAKKGTALKTEKDLAGKIVSVAADSTSFDYVQQQKTKGLAIKEIKAFRLTSEVFLAVKTGHADAIVVDEPVARFFTKQDSATFEISGRAMAPEPIGIGVRKGDDHDLRDAIAKAVEAMKLDGTLKRLSVQWFGGELGV